MENAKGMPKQYKGKIVFFCSPEYLTCFLCGNIGHMASKHNQRNTSPIRDNTTHQEKEAHPPKIQNINQAEYEKNMDRFENKLTELGKLLENVQFNIQQKVQEAVVESLVTIQKSEQKQQPEKEIVDKEGRKAQTRTDELVKQLQMKLEKLEQDITSKTAASDAKLDKIFEYITKSSSSPASRVSEGNGAQ